ncbi:RNA exonuclease 4 [Microdochium trichocladiopsis]|uniref:RNA exonuclease 4 n=1 Tax=Microdochium trichocladiopsis TaxID=1682393 RepID=A0A9P8YCQ5_9PEZI|nr:RNA exonuclease 4 [Microdochium trichocladiopsis]KAH7035510.1 RNA exonuclease 4 [Microdochium trichocladiopsis]
MAPELSSNWKKLQAQIKTEPSSAPKKPPPQAAQQKPAKRKATEDATQISKKHKPSSTLPPKKQAENKRQRNWPVRQPPPSSSSSMGVTQSSAIPNGTPATIKPSLALWADDNGISSEALAEAYNLGVKDNALLRAGSEAEKHRVNEGLAPGLKIGDVGKYIGLDCEMVGIGPDGYDHALARVSVVDFHGKQVYDSFVRPREKVTDWRTSITGITTRHMRTARDFDEVQKVIAELLKDRILVGHDIRHDLAVLMLSHPTHQIRDTARFSGYRKYGHGPKPALRVLAREVLGVEIQGGVHSSIEDARVAMLLFRKKKPEFDVEHAHKFSRFVNDDDEELGASAGAKGKGRTKAAGGKKKKRH